MLPTLFDHMAWADAEAVAALRTLPDASAQRAQAVRLYAHLAAAAHVWLARVEGRAPEYPVWPELPLEAARELAARSLAGLRAVAGRGAAGLAEIVEYRTSAGQPFRNTVGEVLTHVALHGSYHRGQLALLTRQGGGAPATTDYIVFARAASPGAAPPGPRTAATSAREER
jgi:uncharacterized damage-inducible protein DinB